MISGSFKTFHKFVICDTMFAISKRCLNVIFQTSKMIEIQNEDQIQIRLIKLLMGNIIKSKIYVQDFIKLQLCNPKSSKCLLMCRPPTSSSGTPYYSYEHRGSTSHQSEPARYYSSAGGLCRYSCSTSHLHSLYVSLVSLICYFVFAFFHMFI